MSTSLLCKPMPKAAGLPGERRSAHLLASYHKSSTINNLILKAPSK